MASTSMVARPRLLGVLERRWERRVTTLVGGAGFGKTTVLAQAWAATVPAGARQVWLSCEPADELADHLMSDVAQAFGLPADTDSRGILDAIWALSPAPVCLIFDDVHELSPDSSGAAWLAELLTEASSNAHLVLASRDAIPFPLSRLVAAGQVERLDEADLLFDGAEVEAVASVRGVEPDLLSPAGRWPALVELTASAGRQLMFDFLWEEILERLGAERARHLARLSVVGGGDDEIVAELIGPGTCALDVVRGIPLVTWSDDGWVLLHPLWYPALRRVILQDEATEALRTAAAVHRRRGRFPAAFDLLAEAGDWDSALEVICDAERRVIFQASARAHADQTIVRRQDFGRWIEMLPATHRREPGALLAQGVAMQAAEPTVAAEKLRLAATGFRECGDVDRELAAISREGLVRWWMNDTDGLIQLYGRIAELADTGSREASVLAAIGLGALAHLAGQSDGVLAALDPVVDDADPAWLPTIQWLRSVAYRREGNLAAARRALDEGSASFASLDAQVEVARLRIAWLSGDVDRAAAGFLSHFREQVPLGDRFLTREAALEAAMRSAWLGDATVADELLSAAPDLADVPSVLADVLRTIAQAAIAVEHGDEPRASSVLRGAVLDGPAALGSPESWYWRDRAALELIYVLEPESRPYIDQLPLSGAFVGCRELAQALVALREGNLTLVAQLRWPGAGVVRAHLPQRWVAELVSGMMAAGSDPRPEVLDGLGPTFALSVRAATSSSSIPVSAGARQLLSHLREPPPFTLGVSVLGPLVVTCDGATMKAPNLRRARVRELLCALVALRRVRREELAELLWPDAVDAGRNLRVTLSYLNRVFEPDRVSSRRPYFVETTGPWIGLVRDDHLEIDAWRLEDGLERALDADRSGTIVAAVELYASVLPLWTGVPFGDLPFADWVEPTRVGLQARYVTAALRVGELWLAAGSIQDARYAAERALIAEPWCEQACGLLARTCLAAGDESGARAALARGRQLLAGLGVEPSAATIAIEANLRAQPAGAAPVW